jgi:hypothetical protein
MLAMFENLINEHGSSVILKERLELFSDNRLNTFLKVTAAADDYWSDKKTKMVRRVYHR